MSLRAMVDAAQARGIDPLGARGRLLGALIAFALCALLVPVHNPLTRALAAWDVGALTLTVLSWTVLLRASPDATQQRATAEDPGRRGVFLIVVVSSLVSLTAAIVALRLPAPRPPLLEGLAVAAVVLGWIVTHTAHTFRYARLYYTPSAQGEAVKGLGFPGDDPPDDMDFAYFSFTVGMAFQVSDVSVTSSAMRRSVFWHAFQSFVFNTIILALALNFLFGSLGGG